MKRNRLDVLNSGPIDGAALFASKALARLDGFAVQRSTTADPGSPARPPSCFWPMLMSRKTWPSAGKLSKN